MYMRHEHGGVAEVPNETVFEAAWAPQGWTKIEDDAEGAAALEKYQASIEADTAAEAASSGEEAVESKGELALADGSSETPAGRGNRRPAPGE